MRNTADYRRRRKRTNPVTGILVFLAAAAIFILLATTVFFNAENIRVTGASNYTVDEIIDASGILPGDNLVRLDTESCGKKIETALVYIEKATLTRSFPNTIVIDVQASVPAANFITGSSVLLVSSGKKILDRLEEPKAGLLNFYGTTPRVDLQPGDIYTSSDEHKDSAVCKLLEYFDSETRKGGNEEEPETSSVITAVNVENYADLSYIYDGRITVKLGTVSDIEYKIDFSRKIIETNIGERTEGVLTILNSSASFLDKESLENYEQIYLDNIAASKAAETEAEETESSASEGSESSPRTME